MSVTRNRIKIKHDGEPNNYISYFQSVITIGIVSRGRSIAEAEQQSRAKMDSSKFTSGVINQTPFEISETEPWNPEFMGVVMPPRDNKSELVFGLNDLTRQKIADKLNKSLDELSNADFAQFVQGVLQQSLQS